MSTKVDQETLKKRVRVMEENIREHFDSGFLLVTSLSVDLQVASAWGDWVSHMASRLHQNPDMLLEMQRACGIASELILKERYNGGFAE